MRYILLAVLVTGSAVLSGCFNDNDDNDFDTNDGIDNSVKTDQANAQLAADRVSAVINASKNVNTDEPQNVDRIILPEANTAEPVAVSDANASL